MPEFMTKGHSCSKKEVWPMLQLSGQSKGEADLCGALLATKEAARICIKATLAYDQRGPGFGF